MRVISCLFLVAAVSAAPVNLNFEVSVDFINALCAKIQDPSKANYTIPWIVDPVCSAPTDVKQQLADFANNFHSGKYPIPHDRPSFSKLINAEAPAVGKIYQSVYDQAIEHFKKLTPGAQKFVAKWEGKGYENLDADRGKMFIGAMQNSYEFVQDAQALTPEDWNSLSAEFGGFVNAYNSAKSQTLISFIKQLGPSFDWATADQATINKAMDMTLAEFMPPSSSSSS